MMTHIHDSFIIFYSLTVSATPYRRVSIVKRPVTLLTTPVLHKYCYKCSNTDSIGFQISFYFCKLDFNTFTTNYFRFILWLLWVFRKCPRIRVNYNLSFRKLSFKRRYGRDLGHFDETRPLSTGCIMQWAPIFVFLTKHTTMSQGPWHFVMIHLK